MWKTAQSTGVLRNELDTISGTSSDLKSHPPNQMPIKKLVLPSHAIRHVSNDMEYRYKQLIWYGMNNYRASHLLSIASA